jgi:hypothetical protein
MQRNLENVFRPHEAELLAATRALGGLSRKGFRATDTNAGA